MEIGLKGVYCAISQLQEWFHFCNSYEPGLRYSATVASFTFDSA